MRVGGRKVKRGNRSPFQTQPSSHHPLFPDPPPDVLTLPFVSQLADALALDPRELLSPPHTGISRWRTLSWRR